MADVDEEFHALRLEPDPVRRGRPRRADIAYLARHVMPSGAVVVHIAGVHALGSVGAAQYLTEHPAELWAELGNTSFSMVVGSELDGLTPTALDVLVPPQPWP